MGLYRGHKAHPLEWAAEKLIFLTSLSAIVLVILIFVFVLRESLPIFLGRAQSSSVQAVIPPEEMGNLDREDLRNYLGLTKAEFERADEDTLKLLMELKMESALEAPDDKDASVNTTKWRYILFPYQWTGYDKPEYIWQPVSNIPKYNIVPLLIGSLKVTLVALMFGVPLAIGAAIYTSQLAAPRMRELIKPSIEFLSGIPSVVLGFFALAVLAGLMQSIFGYQSRLNAFVAGIALGLAIIPVVFSLAEDAMSSVPKSYVHAALSLGSTRWQTAWKIVVPAAAPGIFAAIMLGFGRAMGETMIVLMASGNASIVSWDMFDSTRTVTATIAAELAEAVHGGHHYSMLFMIGALLFVITFLTNVVSARVMNRLKQHLEGVK